MRFFTTASAKNSIVFVMPVLLPLFAVMLRPTPAKSASWKQIGFFFGLLLFFSANPLKVLDSAIVHVLIQPCEGTLICLGVWALSCLYDIRFFRSLPHFRGVENAK
jgi:hypothetical protein